MTNECNKSNKNDIAGNVWLLMNWRDDLKKRFPFYKHLIHVSYPGKIRQNVASYRQKGDISLYLEWYLLSVLGISFEKRTLQVELGLEYTSRFTFRNLSSVATDKVMGIGCYLTSVLPGRSNRSQKKNDYLANNVRQGRSMAGKGGVYPQYFGDCTSWKFLKPK